MTLFDLLALLIGLSAIFSYLNYRFLKLPMTIGLMAMGLVLSLLILCAGMVAPSLVEEIQLVFGRIKFDEALMKGMLGFLLFAGALHVDINDLKEQRLVILILATVGTCLSTLIVGTVMYYGLPLLGIHLPWWYALLFGALISPTDPIAVLGILKKLGAPKRLETQITGESLFNDGIGVVVFLAIFSLAGLSEGHGEMSTGAITLLFVQEAFGGALFGLLIGYIGYKALKSIDNYQVEILCSLALVCTGYTIAQWLHISGPIAMVIAGLLIGNSGRAFAMSDQTRIHLDMFWELVDEFLNAFLFVLIGLEVLILSFIGEYLIAGLVAIVIVLLARWLAVSSVIQGLRAGSREKGESLYPRYTARMMTWGGLRGGISVALALSIPAVVNGQSVEGREVIITMTYVVVIFSILVQGLTVGPLMRKWGITSSVPDDG